MGRLEHYFEANDVGDTEKKRAILFTVCGHKTNGLIGLPRKTRL